MRRYGSGLIVPVVILVAIFYAVKGIIRYGMVFGFVIIGVPGLLVGIFWIIDIITSWKRKERLEKKNYELKQKFKYNSTISSIDRPQKTTVTKTKSADAIDYAAEEIKKGICGKCGAKLVLRTAGYGGFKGKKFYGCSNFPKCRNIIPIHNDEEDKKSIEKKGVIPICEKCGAKMVIKTAQQGKYKGQKFYGCSNFPECRNIVNIV